MNNAPVFIKIDSYKEVLNIIDVIKAKIDKSKELLEKINQLKAEEDEELMQFLLKKGADFFLENRYKNSAVKILYSSKLYVSIILSIKSPSDSKISSGKNTISILPLVIIIPLFEKFSSILSNSTSEGFSFIIYKIKSINGSSDEITGLNLGSYKATFIQVR